MYIEVCVGLVVYEEEKLVHLHTHDHKHTQTLALG